METSLLSQEYRMNYTLDLAWQLFFKRVVLGKAVINKESSMQLHYSVIIHQLGELMCLKPGENFNIELEHSYDRKNIDITCSLGEIKAALELKCFMKRSNRAKDLDMYDALNDISRLFSYKDFLVKRFIVLTDNPYYAYSEHGGHSGPVSIKDGVTYKRNALIQPSWVGRWKDKSRDKSIKFDNDVSFSWVQEKGWYYLNISM